MSNSLSIIVDSPPPKLGVSFELEEAIREINYSAHIHEAQEPSPNSFQKGVAEVVGTYIIIFAGCGAGLVGKVAPLTIVGVAIAAGLSLTASIYSVGHVSGAHFNPAVTIAMALSRKFPFKLVPIYVLCQVMGATLASLTLRELYNGKTDIGVIIVTQYSSSTSHLEALMWEFIITFILMFTICGVATDHRGSKDLAGVAIGIVVLFNVIIAGPITGASMNPARSLGPAIVSGVYKNIWVYIVSPILGATTASMVYSFLRVSKPDNKNLRTTPT